MALEAVDYTIKPEASTSNISTEDWPLLLKNYEKRMFC
jgi:H/ACA ribonucleoprotein complex subunit 4